MKNLDKKEIQLSFEDEALIKASLEKVIDFNHNVSTGEGRLHSYALSLEHLTKILLEHYKVNIKKPWDPYFHFLPLPNKEKGFLFLIGPHECVHQEKMTGVVIRTSRGNLELQEFIEGTEITLRGEKSEDLIGVTFNLGVYEYSFKKSLLIDSPDLETNFKALTKAGYPFRDVDGENCRMGLAEHYRYTTKILTPNLNDIKSENLKEIVQLLNKYKVTKIAPPV